MGSKLKGGGSAYPYLGQGIDFQYIRVQNIYNGHTHDRSWPELTAYIPNVLSGPTGVYC